jgi:hypothetical protein
MDRNEMEKDVLEDQVVFDYDTWYPRLYHNRGLGVDALIVGSKVVHQ